MAFQDHYAVLGVPPEATPDEIKRAYRRLAMETHPDRHPNDPDAEDRFRRISAAYAVLSDPAQRARFNQARLAPDTIDINQTINLATAREFFSAVVGDVFGRQRKRRRHGRDIRYTLSVDLAEAILGSEHEIQFEANGACSTCKGDGVKPGGQQPVTCPLCNGRGEVKGEGLLGRWTLCGRCGGTGMTHRDPCPSCRGTGARRERRAFRVKIPSGTDSGAERLVRGHGEPGRFGGPPGDLRVTINVREHPWLTREGPDIVCELPISITEAALGAKVPVPTLTGAGTIKIPAGIHHGTRLRLRGRGVPQDKGGRGDQLVTVVIEAPDAGPKSTLPAPIRARLEGILRQLEALSGEHPEILKRRAAQRKDVGAEEA
ncbi:MAG: J domain-containing protein [Nannocystaceae bacterium]